MSFISIILLHATFSITHSVILHTLTYEPLLQLAYQYIVISFYITILDMPKAKTNTPIKVMKIVYIISVLYDEPSLRFIFAIRITMIDIAIQKTKIMIVPVKKLSSLAIISIQSSIFTTLFPTIYPSFCIKYGYIGVLLMSILHTSNTSYITAS